MCNIKKQLYTMHLCKFINTALCNNEQLEYYVTLHDSDRRRCPGCYAWCNNRDHHDVQLKCEKIFVQYFFNLLLKRHRSGRSRAEASEASAPFAGCGPRLGAGHGASAGRDRNGIFFIKKRFTQNGFGARDSCLVACLSQNSINLLL